MTQTAPERPTGSFDDQLTGRLLHQRIIVLGRYRRPAIDIEIQAENLEHTKNVLMRLISEHTGQPVEKAELDARRDRWFAADEAREYGFVDQVLTDVAALTPGRLAGTFGLR